HQAAEAAGNLRAAVHVVPGGLARAVPADGRGKNHAAQDHPPGVRADQPRAPRGRDDGLGPRPEEDSGNRREPHQVARLTLSNEIIREACAEALAARATDPSRARGPPRGGVRRAVGVMKEKGMIRTWQAVGVIVVVALAVAAAQSRADETAKPPSPDVLLKAL